MPHTRGQIPEPVIWDQAQILSAIKRVTSGLSQLVQLTTNPTSDTKGTVVRNVRDFEIIDALAENTKVLLRIEQYLILIANEEI